MDIKISKTNKRLSSHAGLIIAKDLLESSRIQGLIAPGLPELVSGKARSQKKFSDLLLGFLSGADCLDDMTRLGMDAGFTTLCGDSVYTPKTYGDFLRSFTPSQIRELQAGLMGQAFESRRQVCGSEKDFVFDMDATPNQQYGKKMEGVEMNYNGVDCLDSLDVFDQFGFQYSIDVRSGSSKSAYGSELVVHKLMKGFEKHKRKHKPDATCTFRGDRGYYTKGFVNACLGKNADIVLGVVQHPSNFPKIVNQVHNWKQSDQEDPERIMFYDGRECEIGTTRFRPADFARSLRYVVMRAKKEVSPLFPDHIEYDYFAFCTTLSEEQMSAEDVILFYRKRGNAENFIKENKYGFDMKHYPCLKLDANRVYALIGAYAYNVMRLMSLMDNKDKPIFSKNIRFKWIQLPCLVARTGRETVFRYMEHHYSEVQKWFERIKHLQFEYA